MFLIVIGATCIIPMVGAQSATMDKELGPAPIDFYKGEVITYEKDVRPIMSYYCISCHGGKRPSKKFALTTYEEVREKTESGPLLQRINDERKPMPKSGLMPKYKREIIEKWAKGGYVK
ncbi:MAG: hypothetical protein ACFHU9_12365 [Fluviicola sp.]